MKFLMTGKKEMKITRRQLSKLIKETLILEKYDTYSTGEVEKAIKRALSILDINSDNLETFMIRVARTESGGNSEGRDDITGHEDNPFQLDKINVTNVKENINLRFWRAFIDNKEGKNPANLSIDMKDQGYESDVLGKGNLSLAAVFAILHVIWKLKAYKPDSRTEIDFSLLGTDVEKQADWWKENYNTVSGKGKTSDFKQKNKD